MAKSVSHANKLAVVICGALILTACARTSEVREGITLTSTTSSGETRVDTWEHGTGASIHTTVIQGHTLVNALPKSVALTRPVDGVFIGISNFEPSANRSPTPAHALGAALAYSIFLKASQRSSDGRHSHLQLVANLRLNPVDPSWDASDIAATLQSLPGIDVWEYSHLLDLPRDHLWGYLRSSSSLTKASILEQVKAQAERLRSQPPASRQLAVFYLATHGALGGDGNRYAIAADSKESDPSTWISYQEIANAFANLSDQLHPIAALVILDTCLVGTNTVPRSAPLTVPRGVMLISAAAPGQYSWHWTQMNESVLLHGSVGSGLFQRRLEPRDLTYYSTLSVVPVAMGFGLLMMEHASPRTCQGQPANAIAGITVVDFVDAIEEAVPALVSLAQENSLNAKQTVQIATDDFTRQLELEAVRKSPGLLLLFGLRCANNDPSEGTASPGASSESACYDCGRDWNRVEPTNVGDMPSLDSIQELSLSNKRLTDLEGIQRAVHVKKLDLSDTNVTNTDFLKGLTELEDLRLSHLKLTDVNGLQLLTGLKKVDLSNSTISNLMGLRTLTHLEELDLSDTNVSEISDLKDLVSLRSLDLYGAPLQNIDALRGLTGLQERLVLARTRITSVEPLRGLVRLQELNLAYTDVRNVDALAALSALEDLNLACTPVSNLHSLIRLNTLRELDLSSGQVAVDEIEFFQRAVPNATIVIETGLCH